jgi:DNA-binding IclR family transcriptional regulator
MSKRLTFIKLQRTGSADLARLIIVNKYAASLLLYLSEHCTNNDNFFVKITQSKIALALGIPQSTVSESFAFLKENKFINQVQHNNQQGFSINTNVLSKGIESKFALDQREITTLMPTEARNQFYNTL